MNSNNFDVEKKNILKLFKEKKFSKVGTKQIKKILMTLIYYMH